MIRFKGLMRLREMNPYVLVSAARAAKVKARWRRPMPVVIRVNGEPKAGWHINMMPVGDGDFYLYLHGDVRSASQTQVGDTVEVQIEFDDAYRNGPQHAMPKELEARLKKSRTATDHWAALPPSRQKEVLRSLSRLKSDEAMTRNLERLMQALSGAETRFMGRTWKDGK